jgi:hypothetical protein
VKIEGIRGISRTRISMMAVKLKVMERERKRPSSENKQPSTAPHSDFFSPSPSLGWLGCVDNTQATPHLHLQLHPHPNLHNHTQIRPKEIRTPKANPTQTNQTTE